MINEYTDTNKIITLYFKSLAYLLLQLRIDENKQHAFDFSRSNFKQQHKL